MKSLAAVAALLLVCPAVSSPQAQTSARITEKIDATASVRIEHSRHSLLKSAKDQGRVDGGLRMDRMMLLLKPSPQQEQALNSLIASQQDKQSPSYHQWLTPAQYAARFGPSQVDLEQITGWLRQQGFTVNSVAAGKQWVEFSGNAAQVEAAFRTEMHHFLVNGEKHVANATDISIPRALAPVVRGVLSLHDFRAKPLHGNGYQVKRDSLSGKLVPATGSSKLTPYHTTQHGFHYLAPGDWAKIYNTSPLLQQGITGAGVSIAVIGADSDIHLSDVRTFRQIFNLPPKDPQIIVNGEYPGFFPPAEVESDLDVEWSGAIAPQATIKFVTSASTYSTAGFNLSLAYIVDNRVAPIMSVSIGACELFLGEQGNAFVYNAYRQAAAEGISIFSASGDTGAAGCDFQVGDPASFGPAVNATASTPYNVAVGGTMFTESGHESTYWNATNRADQSSAIGYIPEAVWSETCDRDTDPDGCFGSFQDFLDASSGGPSSCAYSTDDQDGNRTCTGGYPKPSWQTGLGVPHDGARDLPDVSFAAAGAHDGYLICVEGACQTSQSNGHTVIENAYVVGGTSAGAPSMSGLMALLEQSKGSYQGLINPTLYKLAAAENQANCNSSDLLDPNQPNSCVFRDITAGNNNVPGQTGWDASTGYDLATGLGSINAAKLVEKWNSVGKRSTQTSLSIGKTLKLQHGQAVPMNVLVKPITGSGTPSGDFALITDSGASVLGGALAHGAFSGGISTLPGGKYSVKACYSGNSAFSPSESDPVKVSIAPEDSTITVNPIDINIVFGGRSFPEPVSGPVQYGQPVGLDVTVHGNSGVGSAGGSVFVRMDGATTLGPYTLNAGGNVFVWLDHVGRHGLQAGHHSFVVSYSGDSSFNPSGADAVPIDVDKAGTKYVMNPTPQLDQYPEGSTITMPVLLTGYEGELHGVDLPTGTVQLYDCNARDEWGTCIGFAPIPGIQHLTWDGPQGPHLAQAVFKLNLPVGDHELVLAYSGDANYFPRDGNETTPFSAFFTIVPKPSVSAAVTLTESSSTIDLGGSVTYRVTVRRSHNTDPVPTGQVQLVDVQGNPLSDIVDLVSGNVTIVLPWTFAGTQFVIPLYGGDANYALSYGNGVQTIVNPGHPAIALAATAGNVSAQTQTTFTVLVSDPKANPNVQSPGAENGMVEFWDTLDGHAPQLLETRPLTVGNGNTSTTVLPVHLPVGHNQIVAKFLGTPDWAPSVSNVVFVNVNNSSAGN